jgi:catechol 2,3-dioxygenase-like lactoylglutathione lyase family enzyme
MGVAMGHIHLFVRDVEANKQFWAALLGATVCRKGGRCVVLQIPDLIIFLEQGDPCALSEGSVVDHVCFRVPDVAQKLLDMVSAGYRAEPAPPLKAAWNSGGRRDTGFVWSSEGEHVEIMRDSAQNTKFFLDTGEEVPRITMTGPAVLHHLHFFVPQDSIGVLKAWYGTVFGAIPGKRWNYEAADLPGTNLNISAVPRRMSPTKGRMLDHVGFEVKRLKTFCQKLEACGVEFDKPYNQEPSGVATAFLTDPWGTYIELTEGVNYY